jgi:hypothetical protein
MSDVQAGIVFVEASRSYFSRHFEHFNQYVDIVQKSIGTIGHFFGSHGTLWLVLGSSPQ